MTPGDGNVSPMLLLSPTLFTIFVAGDNTFNGCEDAYIQNLEGWKKNLQVFFASYISLFSLAALRLCAKQISCSAHLQNFVNLRYGKKEISGAYGRGYKC